MLKLKTFFAKCVKEYKSYLVIALGSFIAAISVSVFLAPNKIAAGGVSGLATVVHYMTGWPIGVVTLVLNIPLFIMAMRIMGSDFGIKTVFSTLLYSYFIDITSFLPPLTEQPVLSAVYGGVLAGLGMGLVFIKGATTGGVDVAASVVNKRFSHISVGNIIVIMDLIVVIIAGAVFKNYELSLYAIGSIYVSTRMIDGMVEGLDYAKAVYIISNKPEEISEVILSQLKKGITALSGKGMYTGEKKDVLLCVVRRAQITQLKKIVSSTDEEAFMLVTDVREVLGKGFKYY